MAVVNKKGVVTRVTEKPWQGRNGEQIILYSFQIDGDKRYFRTGTKRPPINEGDYIAFDFETPKNEVDLNSISAVTDEPAPPKSQAAPRASGGANSKDDYWRAKEERDVATQRRIEIQSCRNSAIALVSAALENDCLALGQTKSKRLDILLEQVDEVAARFLEQNTEGFPVGNTNNKKEAQEGGLSEE